MKLKVTATEVEFNHDDLVNIFSGCVDGSNYIYLVHEYNFNLWKHIPEDKRTANPCIEDKLADLILYGEPIIVGNAYADDAEDELSEELKGWYDEELGMMLYHVSYGDFVRAGKTEEGVALLQEFLAENDDAITCENFMQLVVFGELVYG